MRVLLYIEGFHNLYFWFLYLNEIFMLEADFEMVKLGQPLMFDRFREVGRY